MLRLRERIMVVGSGGAGKTTFALRLAELSGLPLIHLDRHHWKPGWEPTPKEEWANVVQSLASADRWIIDGNYGGTLDLRVRRADAVVFFDFSRFTSLWGAIKRWMLRRPRPDMVTGNPERLNPSFLRWIWTYSEVSRPKVVVAIQKAGPDVEVVVVRNRREVRQLLESLRKYPGITSA